MLIEAQIIGEFQQRIMKLTIANDQQMLLDPLRLCGGEGVQQCGIILGRCQSADADDVGRLKNILCLLLGLGAD